jgi:hypothetical protein
VKQFVAASRAEIIKAPGENAFIFNSSTGARAARPRIQNQHHADEPSALQSFTAI